MTTDVGFLVRNISKYSLIIHKKNIFRAMTATLLIHSQPIMISSAFLRDADFSIGTDYYFTACAIICKLLLKKIYFAKTISHLSRTFESGFLSVCVAL
jgi:hypothetical protein